MISHSIGNPSSKERAEINNDSGRESCGLVVATRPLKTFENIVSFFSNDSYGVDMNQDASAGGTPVEVHDGTDTAYWTGSNISGAKVTFDSMDRANNGSLSVKVDNPALGNTWEFDRGSDLSVSGYVSLTIYINVDKDWTAGDSVSVFGYDTASFSVVGNSVLLENYINELNFDVWQKATIPLTDMGLTAGTIDALRMEMVGTDGKAPKFYLDDIQFEQSGTPIAFTLEPETGTWLHVNSLNISMVDAYDSTVTDGTVQGIPYDTLLGVTLAGGIAYAMVREGNIVFNSTISSLMDFMQFPNMTMQSGSDGTNTWVVLNIPLTVPYILKPESADKLSFTFSDDLSGLLRFRVLAGCLQETR